MNITMDNPQGRLYWLAGVIDGEGCFGASYSVPSKQIPNKHVVRVYFQLGMTHKPTIDLINNILIDNQIVSCKSYGTRRAVQQRAKYNAKRIFTINVSGMESIIKLVNLLEDKLICKKEVALLLREYCIVRRQCISNNRRHAPYRKSDLQIIENIREINRRGIKQFKTLRDFTPRLPIEE